MLLWIFMHDYRTIDPPWWWTHQCCLAKEYQFTLEYTSGRIRNIETIGQKWAAFQAINFNSVAQPHYILMMPDGTILAPPHQYTDIPTYLQWLQNGLANVPSQVLGFTLE